MAAHNVEVHVEGGIHVHEHPTKKAAMEHGAELRRQGKDAYVFPADSKWSSEAQGKTVLSRTSTKPTLKKWAEG